ncbi:MAG: beta-ketoacyl synthase N-terminal-like domain-containing protein [Candidatus Aminicenantes bacterium]|jgi:3-oxoacyl-(acyl-carrier-protein) synthase/acyl carrier protein
MTGEKTLQQILQDTASGKLTPREAFARVERFQHQGFTRVFVYDEPYLKDHGHDGRNPFNNDPDSQVVLGVTFGSLAVEAARFFFPGETLVHVGKLVITRPVSLGPGEMVEVNVHIPGQGSGIPGPVKNRKDRLSFIINFRKPGQSSYDEAGSGEFIFAGGSEAQKPFMPPGFNQYRDRCDKKITAREIYGKQKECIRGPSLKTLQDLMICGDEVFGELVLPREVPDHTYHYHIHPALLDGGFVGSMAGLSVEITRPGDTSGVWVPFMMKNIYVYDALPRQCFFHVKTVRAAPEILAVDMTFSDEQGEVFLMLNEFSYRFTRFGPLQVGMGGGAEVNETTVEEQKLIKETGTADPGEKTSLAGEIEDYMLNKLAAVLGIKHQALLERKSKNFMELGIDSNMIVMMSREIERELGLELYPTLFFEYQNLEELCQYFCNEHEGKLSRYFHIEENQVKLQAGLPLTVPLDAVEHPQEFLIETENQAFMPEKHVPVDLAVEDNIKEIAIIGMAGRFAGSQNLEDFWENLKTSKDLISEVPKDHWDWQPYFDENRETPNKTYCKWGSFIEIDKFDCLFFDISPREAIWLDPQLRLLLEVTREAIDDAGYSGSLAGTRTGVYVGSCFRDYWEKIIHMHIPIVDYQASSCVWSLLSGRISYTFDLQGPSIPLDNACASSLTAVYLACRALQNRECDQALAAGVNLLISPLHYIYSSRLQALSPTGHCRTFDKDADGYVPGEGVGVLMLKPFSRAVLDNDNIHAVIKGIGVNHVGRSNNPTAPRPELQTRLLVDTWTGSGINPASLSYIEAHGTGTILGDPIEFSAMEKAFGRFTDQKGFCAIGSAKAHLGHLEAAAGIASIIKTILSMKHKQIPVMPTFKQLNPYIHLENSPFFINRQLQEWTTPPGIPRRAGVNSFGITGNNVHVVLEEYIPQPVDKGEVRLNSSPAAFIFVLSAREQERLEEYARRLAAFLDQDPLPDTLENIVYTLQVGREAMEERLALVVSDKEELKNKLHRCCRGETRIPDVYRGRAGSGEVETIDPGQDIDPDRLAQQWAAGAVVDWTQLYHNRHPRRVSLPTYPFAGERYWLPQQAPVENPPSVKTGENSRDKDNELLEILNQVRSGELDSSEADLILENLLKVKIGEIEYE